MTFRFNLGIVPRDLLFEVKEMEKILNFMNCVEFDMAKIGAEYLFPLQTDTRLWNKFFPKMWSGYKSNQFYSKNL